MRNRSAAYVLPRVTTSKSWDTRWPRSLHLSSLRYRHWFSLLLPLVAPATVAARAQAVAVWAGASMQST
ncbi:MAG: hypothetical protein GY772_31690 [bacterium]|nr:hypothetical protein [bacterium]